VSHQRAAKVAAKAPAPDLPDALLILLIAAGVCIFVLWAGTRFVSLSVFDSLPSFVTQTYSAVWASIVTASGFLGILLKARLKEGPKIDYLRYVGLTSVLLLAAVLFIAWLAQTIPSPSSVWDRKCANKVQRFSNEVDAQKNCPSDTVVWLNVPSGIYHLKGRPFYNQTANGAFICRKDGDAGRCRVSSR
jgi:hypothetical protein